MNFKIILKPISIALLAVGMGQAALAMENPANKDLLNAALCGNIKMVKKALENGADINYADKYGYTALHYISGSYSLDCVEEIAQLLINHGADINRTNNDKFTPLHTGCLHDHSKIVELLVNQGADINCKDKDGWTAVRIARFPEKIKLIIEEFQKQKKAKEDEFKALCSKRLLITWNCNNAQTSENNVDALISFTNRDKQEKLEVKTNQSWLGWAYSFLSNLSA